MEDRYWIKYRDWLLYRVNFKKKNYNYLLIQLHDSPFEAVLEKDNNRIHDAEALRKGFFYEDGINGDFMGHPISVLEVLIALAIRIDDEYIGNPVNPHPEIIFWEMISNLGLNLYDDIHYDELSVYKILGIWINREFDFDGNGSIFPLKVRNFDQRCVEIWDQMKTYLNENG